MILGTGGRSGLIGRPGLLAGMPAPEGTAMVDAWSDLLHSVRLEGAWFVRAEFGAPWCVAAPAAAVLAARVHPRATRLLVCHLLLRGQCWVRRGDDAPLRLAAGDLLLLAHGDAHLIGSGLQHAPVSLDHVVPPRGAARARYGGNGACTELVCGWFAQEREHPHPLLAALPALLHTGLARRPAGAWLLPSVRHAAAETSAGRPGAPALAARVAEALLVEALRGYLERLPGSATGWLAALVDPPVARALALLHGDPCRGWSLTALAQAAGASRSVLAERFARHLGATPMHYLARWRLDQAAARLSGSAMPLSRVAEAAGYGSQAAFARAFKREHGMAPGRWRQQARQGDGLAPGRASARLA